MSCKICGKSSCTESFHSLEMQELFEKYEASGTDKTFNQWLESLDEDKD